jgi:hypothetical protein
MQSSQSHRFRLSSAAGIRLRYTMRKTWHQPMRPSTLREREQSQGYLLTACELEMADVLKQSSGYSQFAIVSSRDSSLAQYTQRG